MCIYIYVCIYIYIYIHTYVAPVAELREPLLLLQAEPGAAGLALLPAGVEASVVI